MLKLDVGLYWAYTLLSIRGEDTSRCPEEQLKTIDDRQKKHIIVGRAEAETLTIIWTAADFYTTI